ncbi:MAG: isopentenyl-diphosphate Delta-isomerase [Candidatus Gottesmanbacteria bacterium]|nr:isopentenyl-diphosphate Delta-isomerase [Candidatus Gottesmanbacteria bacterium]
MEQVVLVDEQNNEIGTASKSTVHSYHTPLHRGFSLFIFNRNHELLVTRRAITKKTFPDVWTNTVCGHSGPKEEPVAAAKRRLKDELGIQSEDIKVIAPYRYRFADIHGIVENEICPILVGHTDEDPKTDPSEVGDWKWMGWREFLVEIQNIPDKYSPWCIEEAAILQPLLTTP